MDCKELIERLRYATCSGCMADDMKDAADVIEALLAERDAAVEDLRGLCWCCAHGKRWEQAPIWSRATTCKHMQEQFGALARSGGKCKCPHWAWRGPQKGGPTP